jgi:hypothetical protein
MKRKNLNYPGRILPIITLAARMIKADPTLLDELTADKKENQLFRLRYHLKKEIPQLADPKHCPNCDASMQEYEDVLDINDVGLLEAMDRIIEHRQEKGMDFTEANKVRVSSEYIHHTQKCRTTKCSKLGLIAKAGNAQWSITRRGYEGLRGERVPLMRVTFRGQILERPETTVTFEEIINGHRIKMAQREKEGKSLKNDHRAQFRDYNPNEYVHRAGLHQGNIL